MSSRHKSRSSALQQLRDAKLGLASRTLQFSHPADVAIYDEVDEHKYREIKRDLMISDAMSIIEDGQFNYIATDSDDLHDDDDETKFPSNENRLKSPAHPAKKRKHTLSSQPSITSAFALADTKAAIHAVHHSKVSRETLSSQHAPKPSTKADDDFMHNLLLDLDSPASSTTRFSSNKKPKHNLIPQTLLSSSTLSHSSPASIASSSKSVFRSIPGPHTDPFFTDDSSDFIDALSSDPPTAADLSEPVPTRDIEVNSVPSKDSQGPSVKKISTLKPKTKLIDLHIPKFPEEPNLVLSTPSSLNGNHVSAVQQQKPSLVSLDRILESDGSTLSLYYLDATEANGVIYLFGKIMITPLPNPDGVAATPSWSSCCIVVKNIERNVYFLPRQVRHVAPTGSSNSEWIPTDEPVEFQDVYNETEGLRSKYRLGTTAVKKVTRNYSFNVPNVPTTADWLKLYYPYSMPQLPSNLQGETFSHVFGSATSALELMILKWKLMGPCWIDIQNAGNIGSPQFSWAKFESIVMDPKSISVSKDQSKPSPPISAMSMSMRTQLNSRSQQEILLISALTWQISMDQSDPIPIHRQVLVRPPTHGAKVPVNADEAIVMTSERAMLSRFLGSVYAQDPDVIMGHNICGFDMDILATRFKALNLHANEWSKFGRLRRSHLPSKPGSSAAARILLSGRLLLDTWLASKEFIGSSKSYSLNYLAEEQLKLQARPDLDHAALMQYFDSVAGMQYLIHYTVQDCVLVSQIMNHLNALSLYKQIANICGHILSRVMAGGRAERNEFLLLHEFHQAKYVVPDKYDNSASFQGGTVSRPGAVKGKARASISKAATDATDEINLMDEFMTGMDLEPDDVRTGDGKDPTKPTNSAKSRKPKYLGGLVLEPKRGYYESFVMLLDFNSLYPSIIQEYNICFTTVSRTEVDESSGLPPLPSMDPPGVLPRIIKTLVDRRRQVKSLMKSATSPSAASQYNIRQLALKLTANSMYGCLGYTLSRFHCQSLAALITRQGREILQTTVDVAKSNGMHVIYGDTDSIMIHVNTPDLMDVHGMARKLKDLINKQYRCLEIELDGVFERMLLLKKKKYAAVLLEGDLTHPAGNIRRKLEVKGLDVVRRDWCGLSHHVSEYVLNQILMAALPRDQVVEMIHDFLTKTALEVRQGQVPLDLFVINKGLAKPPREYTDAVPQPHVQVALAMEARGQPVHVGGTVPYVISAPATNNQANASKPSSGNLGLRAFHPSEFQNEESNLSVDVEWYLGQQVLPPLLRLCEVIDGTNRSLLISKLGLDPSQYTSSVPKEMSDQVHGDDVQPLEAMLTDEERFASAQRLGLRCTQCGPFEVQGLTLASGDVHEANWTCPKCKVPLVLAHVAGQLTMLVRGHVRQYEQLSVQCVDVMCRHHALPTRSVRVYGKCPAWPACSSKVALVYSAHQLYRQLSYYASLFDVKRAEGSEGARALMNRDGVRSAYARLAGLVDGYLKLNDRTQIDLACVFSYLGCQV